MAGPDQEMPQLGLYKSNNKADVSFRRVFVKTWYQKT